MIAASAEQAEIELFNRELAQNKTPLLRGQQAWKDWLMNTFPKWNGNYQSAAWNLNSLSEGILWSNALYADDFQANRVDSIAIVRRVGKEAAGKIETTDGYSAGMVVLDFDDFERRSRRQNVVLRGDRGDVNISSDKYYESLGAEIGALCLAEQRSPTTAETPQPRFLYDNDAPELVAMDLKIKHAKSSEYPLPFVDMLEHNQEKALNLRRTLKPGTFPAGQARSVLGSIASVLPKA